MPWTVVEWGVCSAKYDAVENRPTGTQALKQALHTPAPDFKKCNRSINNFDLISLQVIEEHIFKIELPMEWAPGI